MLKGQFLIVCILFSIVSGAQIFSSDSLQITEVRASETDANIDIELTKHYTFYNPTASSGDTNTLLVYLPGSFDVPQNTLLFPSVAANFGYHVVSLKYENGVSAQGACKNSTDSNCYSKYRKEVIEGANVSSEVDVDVTNSIENRLKKLLIYMHSNHLNDGWDAFITGTEINWSKIAVAGHSQGGGHAAYIGLTKPLKRVLMFASPNDWSEHFNAPAKWVSDISVADKDYFYAFGNINDGIAPFSEQYAIWEDMGMIKRPNIDTSLADGNNQLDANYKLLYTKYNKAGLSANHNSPVRDSDTPLDSAGNPVYKEVWLAMLGSYRVPGNISTSTSSTLKFYPNPAKTVLRFPDLKKADINITNSLGESVQETYILNGLINVEHLNRGLYYINAFSNNTKYSATFIKL